MLQYFYIWTVIFLDINKLTNLQIYNLQKIKCVILDATDFNYIVDDWNYFFDIMDKNMINFYLYTNNSSAGKSSIIESLKNTKIFCPKSNLITISEIAAYFLISNFSDKKINILGTEDFISDFSYSDLNICNEKSDFVLTSDDISLDFKKLKSACNDIKNGAVFYGANKEKVSYYNGFAPACGSICSLIEKSTNITPKFIGLPSEIGFNFITEKTGYSEDEICFISNIKDFFNIKCSNSFLINEKTGFNSIKDFVYSIDCIKNSF